MQLLYISIYHKSPLFNPILLRNTTTTHPTINHHQPWLPGCSGAFKMNVDIALDATNKLLWVGVVIRNSQGEFMAGISKKINVVPSLFHAEVYIGNLAKYQFGHRCEAAT